MNGFVSLREVQNLFLAQENATESLLERAVSEAVSGGKSSVFYILKGKVQFSKVWAVRF